MSLVSTQWLQNNIDKVKVLDSSWHLPSSKRDSKKEFEKEHIINSIFFDIDQNSNKKTDLPHMLPDVNSWEKIVSSLGIENNDNIVIYDNSDLISSCRCWYTFIYFGHDSKKIHILDGGFKKWKKENRKTTIKILNTKKTYYRANEKKSLVKSLSEININLVKKKFLLIDARSMERFLGRVDEPRGNLKKGNIPGSYCLPYKKLIKDDGTFKDLEDIKKIFMSVKNDIGNNVVFTCGSGITASVLALAYSLINNKYNPTIYDGSWAEYGKI